MNTNEEYIEINLKDILFQTLYRWKPIVAVALIAAVLLGGFQAYGMHQAILDPENHEGVFLETQRYEEQLALCEDRIASTQDKIDTLQEYMDHAVMMKADYREVYIAKATYYIDSDYKIMPELNYQNPDKTGTLTWYYRNFLQDYGVYQEISEETGIDTKYLMDLISISVSNNNTLYMEVYHPTERYAKQIMLSLQEKLYEVYDHLNAVIDEHSLTVMLDTCGAYVDESLKERQQSVYDEMLSYQDTLIKQKEELETLEENAPGEPSVLKAFVKWFILGGIAGGAVMVVFAVCGFLFSGRVYSADSLSSHYQLPVFGSLVCRKNKIDPITGLIRKWEGLSNQNTEENNCFLAASLRNHCPEAREILLCSDIGAAESEIIAEALQPHLGEYHLSSVGSLAKEAQALQLLPQCEAVVVVASSGRSSYKNIGKAIAAIRACGKTIAGFVLIN